MVLVSLEEGRDEGGQDFDLEKPRKQAAAFIRSSLTFFYSQDIAVLYSNVM